MTLTLTLTLALTLTLTLTLTPTATPTLHQVVLRFEASLLLAQGFSEGLGGGTGAQVAFSGVTVTLDDLNPNPNPNPTLTR